ncbi:MAG: hypothetical protein LBC62_02805 [Treponema sp.]|jgi:hypothetical protein|nr:hypothetical protein [Treponema sp.]
MKWRRTLIAGAFFFFFLSCAGAPGAYREIDLGIQNGSYTGALASMETKDAKKNIYTGKNFILLCLDRGMIRHYAELWEDSSRDLEEGERQIEAAFTKSLSQEIASYIVNDNTRDYAGEDYEDLYINVFNALNYYHLNDLEGALVEIRRVNEKLRYLSDKYEAAIDKVVASNKNLSTTNYTVTASKFSNSALARYLGVLFYRGNGNMDDARIDLEELREAYALAPDVYRNSLPSSLDGELLVPRDKARLNVLSFTGLSPVKEGADRMIPLPLPSPNNWARLSLPQMLERPSAIHSVEVVLDSGERFGLELLEDMSAVARETFKAKYDLIVLKSIARTIIKAGTVAGIGAALDSGNDSGWGVLFSFLGRIAADVSEQADLRISRYFPGYAYAGGVNVDPGVYSATVNYYGLRGLISSDRRENVLVEAGKLNLMEFVCLK